MLLRFLLKLLFGEEISAQCDWVRIIYEKMGGDVNSIPENCCQMDGVECSQDGHITGINWNQQGLTGSIPQEIGNLVNLKKL